MTDLHERNLTDYLEILRRRAWIVVLAAAITPAAAVAIARSQPRLYSASADVLLTSSATGAQSPLGADSSSVMETQQEIAGSPAVAERVARASRATNRTAAGVRGEASFSPIGSSDVMRIEIRDSSPGIAVTLANEYAAQYALYKRQLDTAFLESTRNEIEARIAALRAAGQEGSALYGVLVQQAQTLLQTEALQTQSAVVLRPASGAAQIQPKPARYGILGALAGLVLGLALALLWDTIDPRIRSTHAIVEILGMPVLASLPTPPRKLRRKRRLAMLENGNEQHADALRILATNLDFANVDRQFELLMITSGIRGEGKSTTAANLAVALARAGKKVTLVDLDLHRPTIERFFDLRDKPGLTSVALGRATLDEALVRVPVAWNTDDPSYSVNGGNGTGRGNGHPHGLTVLEVLAAGPLPPNAGEFGASLAVRSILESLRRRADVVIIDTPPLLEMSDTLSLSAAVDGIVLVARLKSARRPLFRQARQVLDSIPAAKLGVVLTGAEREHGYWYDRYGSSYYSYARRPTPPLRATVSSRGEHERTPGP
jgi:polysaccharide biosynthesis transport protein